MTQSKRELELEIKLCENIIGRNQAEMALINMEASSAANRMEDLKNQLNALIAKEAAAAADGAE